MINHKKRISYFKLVFLTFILSAFALNAEGIEPKSSNLNSSSKSLRAESEKVLQKMPLSTVDRYIVDSEGLRFKLKSVNWYGSHTKKHVVEGLEHQRIDSIVELIKRLGFNSVRLPFSNVMLHNRKPVNPDLIRANPQFIGLTPLEIFDETIRALTNGGLVVILNNHTTLSEWCCIYDYNGLWHHTGSSKAYNQTTEMWKSDWLSLVERYKDNPLVAGTDLRNEVRTMRLADTYLPVSPNWGHEDKNDWHKASEELGNLILQKNPHLLIIVEGINWWGTIPMLGSGERPHLKPVRHSPIHLRVPNKLVYAAHNYAFVGPRHTGDPRNSNGNITYGEMDAETFRSTLEDEWAFVIESQRYYTAPVWVSEFGVRHTQPSENERAWWHSIVNFLIEKDLDFAYWPLNNEEFGLVSENWSQPRDNDWRMPDLTRLMNYRGFEGRVDSPRFTDLSIKFKDDNQSTLDFDWLPGATKGTCPDQARLLGLSSNYRGLCGNIEFNDTWVKRELSVQAVDASRRHHLGDDRWANELTKYECPDQFYATGFTRHPWGSSGILCAASKRQLSRICRSLSFESSNEKKLTSGGDWSLGIHKLQCQNDEYLAAIGQKHGNIGAIICCKITAN